MSYCAPLGIPHSEFLGWEHDDQDKALAWHRQQNESCNRCGTHPDDWKATRFPYTHGIEVCRGCEMLDWTREDEAAKGPGRYPVLKPSKSLLTARGVLKDG